MSHSTRLKKSIFSPIFRERPLFIGSKLTIVINLEGQNVWS